MASRPAASIYSTADNRGYHVSLPTIVRISGVDCIAEDEGEIHVYPGG